MACILIVEDNRANMKLASMLLRSAGHEVLCASDAESGLALAREQKPALILMDLQLPGMDGLAATALLKQDPDTAGIPVIAVTAMAMKSDREKTRVAGCDAYIAKPLRYQQLFEAINRLLCPEHATAAPGVNSVKSVNTRESEPVAGTIRRPSVAGGAVRLVLVAEDNRASQKLISRQLALLGFAADIVADGEQALQRLRCGHYALLLTDLHMPLLDGYQLAAAVRTDEGGKTRMPIVALTASSVEDESEIRRDAGIDDYLSKPLRLAALRTMLEKWLPGVAVLDPVHMPAASARRMDQAVHVEALEALVGTDPAVVREFLSDFRSSAGNIAPQLTAACIAGQAKQAADQAHKLMASARAVGALELGDLCSRMESAGRTGDTAKLAVLLPFFTHELEAVNVFLDSYPQARE